MASLEKPKDPIYNNYTDTFGRIPYLQKGRWQYQSQGSILKERNGMEPMWIRNSFYLVEIILESILFTFFLFHRMEWKNPFARQGKATFGKQTAAWASMVWKSAFCCLSILSGAIVHINLGTKLSTAMLQALSFFLRMLLVSFCFKSTFFNKAFHICLLCLISLFADQASCIAENIYLSTFHSSMEYSLAQALNLATSETFWAIANHTRNTLLYLALEFLIMHLFLFALKDISRLSDKAYGFLVAATLAALLISTYFLSKIMTLNPGLLPLRYQIPFYTINILILILFLSILLLNKITERAFSENMELAEQLHIWEKNEERNKALLESAERLQKWKHDYKNHLIAMKGLAEDGAYGQLQEYILHQLESLPQTFPTVDTGQRVIDALLTNKIAAAQANGTDFQYSVLLPERLPLSDIELTGILGNLLDNAVEACQKIREGTPYVSFVIKPKREMLHIRVKNSSCGEYVYTQEGNLGSTKKDKAGHGKGLGNVGDIVEAHGGFWHVDAEGDYFEVGIYVPL